MLSPITGYDAWKTRASSYDDESPAQDDAIAQLEDLAAIEQELWDTLNKTFEALDASGKLKRHGITASQIRDFKLTMQDHVEILFHDRQSELCTEFHEGEELGYDRTVIEDHYKVKRDQYALSSHRTQEKA